MAEKYIADTDGADRYGVHRTTWWRWARTDPSFPKPIKLSPGCTRWRLSDIESWEAAKADTQNS
jgi:prophage regulatory protein